MQYCAPSIPGKDLNQDLARFFAVLRCTGRRNMEAIKKYETLGYLHDLFKRQVAQTPDQIAVVCDNVTVTFKELDRKTDILAQHLRRSGAKTDKIVAIYMEKCIEYVVAYISILKAGAAYMPLDVAYPSQLIVDILNDANPVCVISNGPWHESIKEFGVDVIVLPGKLDDENSESLYPKSSEENCEKNLDDLAYVCYSSGTTGRPKGVMCPHRGAAFSYTWRHLAFPFDESDRVGCNVFFVWEMLRPLLKGIPLYIIPDNVIYDPRLLAQFIKKHSITRVLVTPSLLETVMEMEGVDLNDFASLRIVWFCGEVVTMSLLGRCAKSFPWIRFLNLYSVSECHDVAASDLSQYWQDLIVKGGDADGSLAKRKFAPVGKVLPGVRVLILDKDLNEQPAGIPGEIYVGGPTLARGYLKRPELNAERFIKLSIDGVKMRLYRTGDWGRLLANRNLEICGRCDSMVKIRGFSVETQAIEAALLQISSVNACVVLAQGEEGTDKQLVAYVVPQPGATKKKIRTALKQKVPNYMIPSYFVFLKKIPILASTGKLNKKALPAVSGDPAKQEINNDLKVKGDETELPKTATEHSMARIWSEVLQFEVTDTEESFFDLGGHSLLAARLLGKMRDIYGVDIEVQTLFTHPTITELSAVVDAHSTDKTSATTLRKIDLRNEVLLNDIPEVDLDIQLRAFWRSVNYGHRWRYGRVLLTGATGFLGAFLLRDLLLLTKTQIYCLVRKNPDVEAKERLRRTMEFYEFFSGDSDELRKSFEGRVHPVNGDVALLELGMNEEDYAYLSYEVDFVIHAAAYVNLVYPYDALKGANVHGTRNVIMFCAVGKIKALHYVSTNSVFPDNQVNCMESDSAGTEDLLKDGYSQSKWVAEQLVLIAMQTGLPATIYRLGNVGGDQKRAGWNPSDFILLVLRASIDAGVWPNIKWKIEMTPADFVSNAIIQLSQNFSASMHKIFHIVNSKTLDALDLCDMVNAAGYDLKKVSFTDWCDAVANTVRGSNVPGHPSPKQMLETVTTARDSSLFSFNTTFDQTIFNKARKAILNADYPTIDSELINRYLKNLSRREMIRKPTQRVEKGLHGKVALVTGASSGIGQAVSKSLAKAGATVCVAARRQDRLKTLVSEITADGGAAVAFGLDVTDRHQFLDVVKRIQYEVGAIDILVNNAGLMFYTHMRNVMMDDWDRMIDVNCRGVTNGIGVVLPGMLRRRRGHIVNTSSDAARRGFAGLAVYSGTKFFIEGLSQGLRHEVKGSGIRVTCIQPGDVKTELLTHTKDHDAKAEYDGSESCNILDPDDIGKAVVYAVTQPDHVGVNEILIEPRENPI